MATDGRSVLVTGGTGFIAQWCIVELIRQEYDVRTTIRSSAREGSVIEAVSGEIEPEGRLTFALADLTTDDGWDAAVEGCDYVLHVASPLGRDDPSDPDALIVPARDGTVRVLRAAIEARVDRVVMTSAANTASPSTYEDDSVTDETLWTDGDDVSLPAYRRSKTIAERAAWDLIDSTDSRTTLSTVLPGAVFGPILSTDNLGSVEVIGRMLRGEMPGTPRIGLEVVDVRDLIAAHIAAMTSPAAAGERFLATGQFMWMGDIAHALRSALGDAASKVPTDEIPDDIIRQFAESSAELRGILPGLGRRNRHSTAKARTLLGWTPRPGADAVVDCARSLIAHGVV